MRRLVLAVIVALALTSAPAEAQQPAPRLVGTWRLIEFCNVDRPGDTTYSLGRHPIGFFMYDAAGNLSIQAMRAAPSGAFTQDSVPLRGMEELRMLYFAYFGSVYHHLRLHSGASRPRRDDSVVYRDGPAAQLPVS